jgi:hypothetical protein
MNGVYAMVKVAGVIEKQAIATGLGGYLTAPWLSVPRAAEMKGALKMLNEDPESMYVNRPVASHFIAPILGALAGGALGGGAGHLIGGDLGHAGAGAGVGAVGGGYLGALLSPFLQQRAVAREIGKQEDKDLVVGHRLRKGRHNPPTDEEKKKKSSGDKANTKTEKSKK